MRRLRLRLSAHLLVLRLWLRLWWWLPLLVVRLRLLRLRRLWRVHQTLVSGAPVQIKSVALANGFWHPGEFSQSYRALFGEPPSQTLCRARGQ